MSETLRSKSLSLWGLGGEGLLALFAACVLPNKLADFVPKPPSDQPVKRHHRTS